MDIVQTTPGTTSPASIGTAAAITSDFETFLKLMTTQLRNQDPLNPIDSADYAVQLATFSSVEQQVKTNQILETMAKQGVGTTLSQLSGWIGQEVRAPAAIQFDGAPVTFWPHIAPQADRAVLVVTDTVGTELQREAIDPGVTEAIWAGVREDGQAFPSGSYRLAVESYDGESLIESAPASVFSKVQEARLENGAVSLVLEGDGIVAADEVTALRAGDG